MYKTDANYWVEVGWRKINFEGDELTLNGQYVFMDIQQFPSNLERGRVMLSKRKRHHSLPQVRGVIAEPRTHSIQHQRLELKSRTLSTRPSRNGTIFVSNSNLTD